MRSRTDAATGVDDGHANILLIEQNIDGTVGGSYFSLLYLAAGLDRSRYRPTVLFEAPNRLTPTFEAAGILVIVRQPRRPLSAYGLPFRGMIRAANFAWFCAHSVIRLFSDIAILKSRKIAVVHLNNAISVGYIWMLAARLCRIPCITHERCLETEISFVARYFARHLAYIICISDSVKQNLLAHGLGHLPLVRIFNGLDPLAFLPTSPPSAIRSSLGLHSGDVLIGVVGNIQRWKGQDIVIRAMAALREEFPTLRCALVGAVSSNNPEDIAYHVYIRQLISELALHDRILFVGAVDNVPDYMNAFDIVLHTSVSPEPFGRVILEAMALSKPVIATRGGGASEIVVHGETGFLVTPGDSSDLAKAVSDLLNNPPLRASMGRAGYRHLCENFTISRNVASTQHLYDSLLHRG